MKYRILVGSMGVVFSTADYDEAVEVYEEYVEKSSQCYGRYSYEMVELIDDDGETILEFDPNENFSDEYSD